MTIFLTGGLLGLQALDLGLRASDAMGTDIFGSKRRARKSLRNQLEMSNLLSNVEMDDFVQQFSLNKALRVAPPRVDMGSIGLNDKDKMLVDQLVAQSKGHIAMASQSSTPDYMDMMSTFGDLA